MQIAILLFDDITTLDAIGPAEVLGRLPGANVAFVAKERGLIRAHESSGALGIMADVSLSDVTPPDILVVPGGLGTRALVNDGEITDWLRQIHETTTWTTSVCTGALLLGAAGLLQGIKATTHWSAYDLLARYGAEVTEQRVVEQGKIVTAAGVSAGIDMALTLAAKLAGADTARAIQLQIEYDPQPPFDSGSPGKASPAVRAQAEAS